MMLNLSQKGNTEGGEGWRKTHDINFWPLNTCTHMHVQLQIMYPHSVTMQPHIHVPHTHTCACLLIHLVNM